MPRKRCENCHVRTDLAQWEYDTIDRLEKLIDSIRHDAHWLLTHDNEIISSEPPYPNLVKDHKRKLNKSFDNDINKGITLLIADLAVYAQEKINALTQIDKELKA